MNIKIIQADVSPPQWNAVAAHPMQSWEWGEARRAMGTAVVRIGVYTGEELIDVVQMTVHPVRGTGRAIGYIPRASLPSKALLLFLEQYAQKHKLTHIRFEPYVQKNALPTDFYAWHPRLRQTHQTLFTPWQFLLDMTPDEETLLARMKAKTRYNIRLAAKQGIEVHEASTQEGLETFIQLYLETCARQTYHGRSAGYLRTVWKYLGGEQAKILIASHQGEPLAAYMLFLFGGILYYPYGGSSIKHRSKMPANLLMWEAIRFGKKHGATVFDMWGALGPGYDKADPWAGFTRFKEGYGGELVEYMGTIDLVVSPLWYRLITTAYDVRKWIWSRQ